MSVHCTRMNILVINSFNNELGEDERASCRNLQDEKMYNEIMINIGLITLSVQSRLCRVMNRF